MKSTKTLPTHPVPKFSSNGMTPALAKEVQEMFAKEDKHPGGYATVFAPNKVNNQNFKLRMNFLFADGWLETVKARNLKGETYENTFRLIRTPKFTLYYKTHLSGLIQI